MSLQNIVRRTSAPCQNQIQNHSKTKIMKKIEIEIKKPKIGVLLIYSRRLCYQASNSCFGQNRDPIWNWGLCKVKVKFDCQHCGASFTQKSILKLHVNGVHGKLKPFKCEDCQASFTLECTLNHHIKAVHDKVKPFKCSDCLKKVNLQIHQFQEHQQTTFSCKICGPSFPQKVDLQFHMSGQHQLKKRVRQCNNIKTKVPSEFSKQNHTICWKKVVLPVWTFRLCLVKMPKPGTIRKVNMILMITSVNITLDIWLNMWKIINPIEVSFVMFVEPC